MNRIASSLLIATLLFVHTASMQPSRAGDAIGAAQVDAIYPDIEKLYIDLHRNPELAFHEQRTAANNKSTPASANTTISAVNVMGEF
jgi:metal-dependent amidase/aminoacylase/carboxypeptidase family protein